MTIGCCAAFSADAREVGKPAASSDAVERFAPYRAFAKPRSLAMKRASIGVINLAGSMF
jgi:hypothetical protein